MFFYHLNNKKEIYMKDSCSQPDDWGIWRFGIISPLLHPIDDGLPLHVQIRVLAEKTFYTPDGRQKYLSADTIRNWLDRYKAGGIDALRNKARKDHGTTSVPIELQMLLAALREQHPLWTIIRLLRALERDGHWDGVKPSRSALYRYASLHALKASSVKNNSPVRSFEFPFFGDLWSADFLHGPKVRQGVYLRKVYLHAIIDDATRYVVAARFHFTEGTQSLLDDFMLAIRRFGIPKRLYTDNGAAFRSKHLQLVAARLGVALPHTPPYTPRGRGKIERFFRNVREGFLTGIATTTLDDLNVKLNAWIQQYHSTYHHTLCMSPLNRKLTDKGSELQQIAATKNIDEYFFLEHHCRVGSDGCVRLFKKRFEIPHAIVGSEIIVYYLPWNQEHIFAGAQKQIIMPLDTINNALRFDKPQRGGNNNRNPGEKS
jgi:transposase InsO family protein